MSRNFRKPTLSMRGVVIDMDAMRAANEDSRAIGNANMNARGDLLGRNGEIEVRREQIARDYQNQQPQAARPVSLKPAMPDVFETPAQAMERIMGGTPAEVPQDSAPKKARKLVDRDDN